MSQYSFVRTVDVQQLTGEIKETSLSSLLVGAQLGGRNFITITFSRLLTDQEYQILYNTMVSHSPPNPAVVAAQQKVSAAMDFGISIIQEYSAMNSLAKLPVPVVEALMSQLLPIMIALQSGSLYTALDLMGRIPPSPYMSQSTVTYFVNKIKRYLGV